MLNINKLLDIFTFKSKSEEKKFLKLNDDSQLKLIKNNNSNPSDLCITNEFEKLESYDREIVYCSLIFVIGKSFYFTIKDLFQLKFESNEKKKIKCLFGIAKRIELTSNQVKIFLTDPSSDETFTFFSTDLNFNLGDIVKICNFEVEIKSSKPIGVATHLTQLVVFNNVSEVFENDQSFLNTSDIHIILELQKWFAKKVIQYSLKDNNDKFMKDIAFKILFYKKFKDFISLVVVDTNEYNSNLCNFYEKLSHKDLLKVKKNFQSLLKFNFEPHLEEVLMKKMCIPVEIYSSNLDLISKVFESKITQGKDIFVFYNLFKLSIDSNNTNLHKMKLAFEPLQFSFMHLSCCDINSHLIDGFNKKIDSTILSIKVELLCDEINGSKRKFCDYHQSTPSKKFKHDDSNKTNITQTIQTWTQQNIFSTIHQSMEEDFIDSWIDDDTSELNSVKSNESSSSTIIYSISDDSLTEEEQGFEDKNDKKISQRDVKTDLNKNYPYSFQALKAMNRYKLMEYKKLAIKSQNDAIQKDKSSLNQLIEMINQVLDDSYSS